MLTAAATYHFRPFRLEPIPAALFGIFLGAMGVLLEMRLRKSSLKRLIGAVVGAVAGIFLSFLMSLVLSSSSIELRTQSFLHIVLLLVMAYLGMIIGANKGDLLNLQALGGLIGTERTSRRLYKVLDTSVIIDGRVADVCEAGFLDGTLVIPRFVLRELQMVADSADPLKRNRGRRGLDILQRIQKLPNVDVQIVDQDFPQIREVDMKLIELARCYEGKVVTNDFNLNKVAQLQGIKVLNINELANALKPVVLPGEAMRVFILKEGKEPNQGVAYLDDGTMVVVDNARRLISRTIDITVTSVLQTTAGKMIFGRYEEGRPPAVASGGERERNHTAPRPQAVPPPPGPRPARFQPVAVPETRAAAAGEHEGPDSES
ncbi:MAG TPA: PIN domain-containing protein [Candidatus Acidoferrales bacterium]|nr:PIN domain-containing protein [Candidatus Acidoferrales bacterium]